MTPYEVLGIRPDATEREAEDAYNRLLRIHHPDLHQGGSAEEIAAAEAMTRALNAAMHQVRASFATAGGPAAANAPGGAGAGPTADGEARYRPPGDGTGPRGPGPGWGGHDADRGGSGPEQARWDEEPSRPVAACPFCGEQFDEARRLRTHVSAAHKVRLEHRRRSRLGRALDRFFGRWDHISLWHLLPLNVIVALMIAVAVTPLATDFAYWAFGVAMAPTIILALERPGR